MLLIGAILKRIILSKICFVYFLGNKWKNFGYFLFQHLVALQRTMTTMMLIETWLKKNFILIHVGMSRFAFCKIVRLKYFLLFVALLPHLIGLFYPMIDDIKICHFFAWLVRMNYGCSFFFFTKQSSWLDNLRNQNSNQGNSVPLLLQKNWK